LRHRRVLLLAVSSMGTYRKPGAWETDHPRCRLTTFHRFGKEPSMKTWTATRYAVIPVVLFACAQGTVAAPPWNALLPFKRVEANPQKTYTLHEENGPWLILAASFQGDGAEQHANELVLELRDRYKLNAYAHRQVYDFTKPVRGLTINKYGEWAKMRYANASKFEAIAVLVGDFPSVDDPHLERTLDKLKFARPACLDLEKRDWSAQGFATLRAWYRRVNRDSSKHNKGPMGNAFVTRNPLLPESYFAPNGVDDFVLGLNRGVKYGLLDNPGKYTVKVATFRGNDTINQREIAELEATGRVTNKLEIAADNAHRLTVALREKGVEAYEFHDRHESIVTVGSFETEGTPLANGTIDINPAILQIMKSYGASREPIPGQQLLGLRPRTLAGIPFDIQPLPMKVPRRSLAMDYARRDVRLR
jgi:hypothetical protein